MEKETSYLNFEYPKIYLSNGRYYEYCLKNESGKYYYARNSDGDEFYPRDSLGRIHVLRNGDEPLFIIQNKLVDFVHIDTEFSPMPGMLVYRTTPELAVVGRLYLKVMSSKDGTKFDKEEMYQAWQKAGLSEERFKIHPKTYKNMTIYQQENNGYYFVFLGDKKTYVSLDRRNKLCFYDLESPSEKYNVDSRGNKLYFDYHDSKSKDKYFYVKNGSVVHLVLSNNTEKMFFYKKVVGNKMEIYEITTSGETLTENLIHFNNDDRIYQELDVNKNIVCFRIQRGKKREYFWYERGQLIRFDYVMKKYFKKRFEITSEGKKEYFEWDGDKKIKINEIIKSDDEEEEEDNEEGKRIFQTDRSVLKTFILCVAFTIIMLLIIVFV
jgi:hypothetical protein